MNNHRRLFRRLAIFLLPLFIVGLVGGGLLLRTGELLPASFVARLQTLLPPFVYLARYTDHTYQLKVAAVEIIEPEIVAMGSSRANQWRSAMFRPMSFYNAGNAFYSISDFSEALEAWGEYSPRIIIMTVDYFMFIDAFQQVAKGKSRNDFLSQLELAVSVKGMAGQALGNLALLYPDQREPIYNVPALGLTAMQTGTGARIDGSYQYGHAMLDYPQVSVEQALDLVSAGNQWPLQGGAALVLEFKQQFEQFARIARERGIKLVAVTPPFDPAVLAALWDSPKHGAFRAFHSPETAAWLRSLGIIYFDFSNLVSINGEGDEFIDPYHPSEPAFVRMLIEMAKSPEIRAILPNLDSEYLARRVAGASRLEVFKNEF